MALIIEDAAAVDWGRFCDALALSLAQLDTDQAVILEARRTPGRYVRFVHYGPAGLRADTSGEAAGEELAELGWLAPAPAHDDEEDDGAAAAEGVDGDPRNWHRQWSQPVPYEDAAGFAVTTLRVVHGVPTPALLSYNALHQSGAPIILPNLGVVRSRPVAAAPPAGSPSPQTHEQLLETVRQVLAERIGVSDVPVDADGDIPITTDAARLFVRVRKEALVVTTFCPLVWGFGNPPEILEAINQLNKDLVFARAVWNGSGVVLVTDTLGDPFDADVFWNDVMAVVSLSAMHAPQLQARFGGQTAFGAPAPAAEQKTATHRFGYL